MRNLPGIVNNVLLWRYARGTFQYDILCTLILLFIFLTPRSVFQDWPVINSPHQFTFGEQIVDTYDDKGNPVLNVSTKLVPALQDSIALKNFVKRQLEKTLNKPISIADIKPIVDGNGETVGYSIWLGQQKSNTSSIPAF
jgi:hypothetical protein